MSDAGGSAWRSGCALGIAPHSTRRPRRARWPGGHWSRGHGLPAQPWMTSGCACRRTRVRACTTFALNMEAAARAADPGQGSKRICRVGLGLSARTAWAVSRQGGRAPVHMVGADSGRRSREMGFACRWLQVDGADLPPVDHREVVPRRRCTARRPAWVHRAGPTGCATGRRDRLPVRLGALRWQGAADRRRALLAAVGGPAIWARRTSSCFRADHHPRRCARTETFRRRSANWRRAGQDRG